MLLDQICQGDMKIWGERGLLQDYKENRFGAGAMILLSHLNLNFVKKQN